MRGFFTVYRRELAGLFLSPVAWVLLCLALVLNVVPLSFGLAYDGDVMLALSFVLGGAWPFWLVMVILPALITMRMVSEEARTGVLEYLLTAPVTDVAVIAGKLAAATTLLAIVWSSALVYGVSMAALGTAPDWPPVISGFCGAVLVSALFCSIGLTMSCASNTPVLAAFLSVIASTAVLLLPWTANLLKLPSRHWLRIALGHGDVAGQFGASFGAGVLDTKHVALYVAWTAFFVFVATRMLEARRWR
jgi:ABC-2 type transport system permease protein